MTVRARPDQARLAVLDALLDLLHDRATTPTRAEVAERAGVSRQTLDAYFADVDTLFEAAVTRQAQRLDRLASGLRTDGALDARLTAFVETRAAVLEAITPLRAAALRNEAPSGAIVQRARWAHGQAYRQVEAVFEPELARLAGAEARRELAGRLAAAASWVAWERLRHAHGLSVVAARQALQRELRTLLRGK